MVGNKWTKANRITEVIRHEAHPAIVGKFPGPPLKSLKTFDEKQFSKTQEGDTVWMVWITTRTGLDKETVALDYFATEEDAEESIRSVPVGSKFGEGHGFSVRLRDFFEKAPGDTARGLSMLFSAGGDDPVDFVCYDALSAAGVISEKTYRIAPSVLDWLGHESVDWMKSEFGENWEAVGTFEYCINHYPRSSIACLAAQLFLARFVTNDDFTAGYLTKEIEVISGGTEEAATVSTELRKRAGKGGGEASRKKRLENLNTLIGEIEKLSGAVGLISEERIIEQAFEAARNREPKFPKSKRTLDDYGTALRSEEPFKSRYEAVFRKNA